MINNRQQGGRRRGRGGQRPQNLGGRPDGNRQDNRQRGNAAQLLEKYKSMARDAQLAGDRVQTEYYLQFADHYYRILGESRARFDEQRRARGEDVDDADNGSSYNEPGFQPGDDDQMDAGDDQGSQDDGGDDDRPQRNDRYERDRPQPRESRDRYEGPDRNERPERDARPERNERPERDARPERNERPERDARPERSERPERNDRPQAAERNPRRPRYARDDRNGEEAADRGGNAPLAASPESIAFDALPPAIGRVDAVEPDNPEDAPRPKRRAVRKPRATGGDTDAAPAG